MYIQFLQKYDDIVDLIILPNIAYNSRTPMYPHHPSYITHARTRAHLTSYFPAVYCPHKSSIAAY